MLDDIKEFWAALSQIPYATTIATVVIVLLVLAAGYIIFIKKDMKLKAAIIKVVQEALIEAKDKGVTVEFVVDDIIKKAEIKIKAKPNSYDALLLYFIHAKWFRSKLIKITTKIIEDIMAENTDQISEIK